MIIAVLAAGAVVACTPGRGGVVATPAQVTWMADAWARSARPILGNELGLTWNGTAWALDASRPSIPDVAAQAYFAQPYLDAGINFALSRCNRALLDEMAGYYVAAFERFETFRDLAHARGAFVGRQNPDDLIGDADTRTLPWIHPASGHVAARSAECLLCVSQFLHPAARLVGLFAVLPLGGVNDLEQRFIKSYVPLIVRDQVLRFAYQAPINLGLQGGDSRGAVAGWKELIPEPLSKRTLYPAGLLDVHLWLIADAAEILGAQSRSPILVSLSTGDSSRLQEFLRVGLKRFQQSGSYRVVGRDSAGRPVTGLDFFEGEFARHNDYAFAGDSSPAFPSQQDGSVVDSVGWDISHATRFPMVLRSLHDSRDALGMAFPADSDLSALAHQLTYRVFNGDLSQPDFRNFMDGTDGWFRAGYSGRGQWGYPPSHYCDARDQARQCLSAWVLPAWGQLAPYDSRLGRIADRLIQLAETHDTAFAAFRDRHYFQQVPFSFDTPDGARPSLSLFELLADFAPPAAEWAGAVRSQ